MSRIDKIRKLAADMSYLSVRDRLNTSEISIILRKTADWLVDLLFPPSCGGCGKLDYHYCDSCLDALKRVSYEPRLSSSDFIDSISSTGPFVGPLASAIRAFKYSGARELGAHLAERLKHPIALQASAIDVLAPVSLAEKRLQERGYNQSDLLCSVLSHDTGLPWREDLLLRNRETEQQARLRSDERITNVRGAFTASDDAAGLSIALIDDVVTTGSTLMECARALKLIGAKRVIAFTIVHA